MLSACVYAFLIFPDVSAFSPFIIFQICQISMGTILKGGGDPCKITGALQKQGKSNDNKKKTKERKGNLRQTLGGGCFTKLAPQRCYEQ